MVRWPSRSAVQRRLERVGRQLAGIALAIVIVFFLLGLLRGEPAKLMFVTAISMAVVPSERVRRYVRCRFCGSRVTWRARLCRTCGRRLRKS